MELILAQMFDLASCLLAVDLLLHLLENSVAAVVVVAHVLELSKLLMSLTLVYFAPYYS